jgi:putative transposase
MTLYQNKYRIESARLKGWDYRSNGFYFVTICTHDQQHFFGDIVNGEMQLSAVGEIVAQEWEKTPRIRPYVELDEWVVMPNHFHAIIAINNQPPVETFRRNVSTINQNDTHTPIIRGRSPSYSKKFVNPYPSPGKHILRSPPKIFTSPPVQTFRRNVSTTNHGTPQNPVQTTRQSTNDVQTTRRVVCTDNATTTGLKSKSLGAIIGQFKSVCTKQIWAAGYPDFRWQSRFHDHIIRDETALHRIRQYIANNPMKWHEDRHNSSGLYM